MISRCARAAALLVLIAMCACGRLDDDTDLINRWHDHRATFDRLVAMSDSDSTVVRIAYTFTRLYNNWQWPRDTSLLGLSQSRWNSYRDLRHARPERWLTTRVGY
jgi:hypothetical protein